MQLDITKCSCPACGGRLVLADPYTGLVVCGYCGNRYLVNGEQLYNVTYTDISQGRPVMVQEKGDERDKRGWYVGFFLAAVLMFILLTVFLFVPVIRTFQMKLSAPVSGPAVEKAEAAQETEEAFSQSRLMEAMLEEMFGTGAVTAEKLDQVTYLSMEPSGDSTYIQYSFGDPAEDSPEIYSAVLPEREWDGRDLGAFTGLVRLEMSYDLFCEGDLSGLTNLREIVTSGAELSSLAELVADPGQIRELDLRKVKSVDGISMFTGLERLTIENMPAEDVKQLVSLESLKQLSLVDNISSDSIFVEEAVRVVDYTAISRMTALESLYIRSDILKEISFLSGLPRLTSLELEDTVIISLEPLKSIQGLQCLHLSGNDRLKDYSPVSELSGLQDLQIYKQTSDPDPDISTLKELKKLEISGFMSVSSLSGLTNLQELSIHDCNVEGAQALSTLTGVERLTFYSVWESYGRLRNLDFLDGMTGLKYMDFCDDSEDEEWMSVIPQLQVYGDISSVFNHPGLEELYLNHGMYEINFDRIVENPTLRVLRLEHQELHENFYVESYGGMSSIWYDDVELNDHLDFLGKFPNLEELYLTGNGLTDLEFVSSLESLTRLDVSDNAITDLAPLMQANALIWLDIRDNPAKGAEKLDAAVEIIQ